MRLFPLRKSIFFHLVLMASLGACALIAKRVVQKPDVRLQSVSLSEVNSSTATLQLGILVENPNTFSIKVDRLKYEVEVGGKKLSSGSIDHPTEVPGREKAVVEIRLPVKYSDVFASMIDFLQNSSSTYRIKGEATVGLLVVPFDEKGEVSLGKRPKK